MSAIKEYDDTRLLRLIKIENMEAFNEIYDRYADKLYGYVFKRLHNKETSKEIVQEVFISLWEKRNDLKIIISLESYLFGAAKYKILSYIRSRDVRKKYAGNLASFLMEHYDNSLEEFIAYFDLQTTIERSISKLPERCQVAFRMSRIDHLPIKDIALKMNISTRTVENYITMALKHLRSSLKELLIVLILSNSL